MPDNHNQFSPPIVFLLLVCRKQIKNVYGYFDSYTATQQSFFV